MVRKSSINKKAIKRQKAKVNTSLEQDATQNLIDTATGAEKARESLLTAINNSNLPDKSHLPKVTKNYPRRSMLLAIFGLLIIIGAGLAIIYVLTMNMALGLIGIPFLFGGGMGFYYYWGQSKDIQVKYVGDVPREQVNALIIQPDIIKFTNINDPKGFVWYWIDDGKPYYIYWENPNTKRLEPFNLPDQQYYSPQVCAERVLTLPCHRKIFQRRPDLLHKLKPFIAALIFAGLWILIITTTGGDTGV